jgi:tRNA(fMet)-specific endonuclease VapC
MRTYLLDTDTCIYAIKGERSVLSKMSAKSPAAIFISVVTEGELRTGAEKSVAPVKARRAVDAFLMPLQLVDFTSEDAACYARIRAALEKEGTPIGPLDTLIAAQAVSRGHWLVTNNQREFQRVDGAVLENWSG